MEELVNVSALQGPVQYQSWNATGGTSIVSEGAGSGIITGSSGAGEAALASSAFGSSAIGLAPLAGAWTAYPLIVASHSQQLRPKTYEYNDPDTGEHIIVEQKNQSWSEFWDDFKTTFGLKRNYDKPLFENTEQPPPPHDNESTRNTGQVTSKNIPLVVESHKIVEEKDQERVYCLIPSINFHLRAQ